MSAYYVNYTTYLTRTGTDTFTTGETYPTYGSLDAGSDDKFTVGEILYEVDNFYSVSVGEYVGYYKDAIIYTETRYYNGVPDSKVYILSSVNNYDGAGSITINAADTVTCFLSGVAISTPSGPRPVESLAPGDLVLTAYGQATPVKWMGRQSTDWNFNRDEERAPICISAGALAQAFGGETVPSRDLRLTADHALLIDGMLVQAGALVNGSTIRRMTRAETGDCYDVWHIETEDHAVILAEGCPAETFIDNVTRRRFDNYAEYEALYGEDAATMAELDLPRVMSPRRLPAGLRALVWPPLAA